MSAMSNQPSTSVVCCAACGKQLFARDKAGEVRIAVTTKAGGSLVLIEPICLACSHKAHGGPEGGAAIMRAACPRMLALKSAA